MTSCNIRPLQLAILGIFKEFAKICERHSLKYYAAYGTCLGAVRHNGFIPWDDDFDVMMPRPDYERLKCILDSELPANYRFTDWSNSVGLAPLTFGKIQNCSKDSVVALEKKLGYVLSQGVYIDIFPLDGIPQNKIKLSWLKMQDILLLAAQSSLNGVFGKRSLRSWFGRGIGLLARKTVFKASDIRGITACRDNHARRYKFEANNVCGCVYGPYGVYKDFYQYDIYGKGKSVPFEGVKIVIPDDSDAYLKGLYGDYMKLPPIEKRMPTHQELPVAPWKFGPAKE